ncbi:ABC transporter substrate-binding protein [Verminephrobacter aporrectodeae subsp. tuberculatae]|uniref:ABC transporter substrate-binding protein n=1 Tax=Verminephrobacter aporrectodeae TaxID=1110389 RepID=UPI00223773F7|nr:ABC transporter substrate-binding protein [Verminephrobacter aporrectodeae]MCW5255871.1 ABC transporter substrate-binding protein [Verminephrobacter aporrectodeae subsp. tuberculatae]MCW8198864.1 ABC transporter substrate-binding protein [Verminephrobacter aporrectodeae subsp. tuberculatae]MCW8208418.1 ABC transporter substrate-binding protein [Verminephrobacter aporrectodeae subsp. tuberculatae]
MTRTLFIGIVTLAMALGLPTAQAQTTRAKGAPIRAAVVSNYPPLEYKDPASGKLVGFDIDLGEALAARLGTTIRWEETSFDQMTSSLATGRVDIILSGMTDLATRREVLRFIDYLKSGPQFYVLSSRAAEFASPQALCGRKIGTSRRTSFPAEVAAWSAEHCEKAGKSAITVIGTDGSADARAQLRQGRIDAAVQGGETLHYIFGLEPNTYTLVGKPFATQYVGLATGRKDEAFSSELAAAMRQLIADGSYAKIAAKWGLTDYAVTKLIIDSAD